MLIQNKNLKHTYLTFVRIPTRIPEISACCFEGKEVEWEAVKEEEEEEEGEERGEEELVHVQVRG